MITFDRLPFRQCCRMETLGRKIRRTNGIFDLNLDNTGIGKKGNLNIDTTAEGVRNLDLGAFDGIKHG